MPVDWSKYPSNWKTEIRPAILDRAQHCCEGSPAYPDCRAENHKPHPVTGSKVVLTIAHLNHDTKDNRHENLRAWCQRCHNTYDAPYRRANRRLSQRNAKQGSLFDALCSRQTEGTDGDCER